MFVYPQPLSSAQVNFAQIRLIVEVFDPLVLLPHIAGNYFPHVVDLKRIIITHNYVISEALYFIGEFGKEEIQATRTRSSVLEERFWSHSLNPHIIFRRIIVITFSSAIKSISLRARAFHHEDIVVIEYKAFCMAKVNFLIVFL